MSWSLLLSLFVYLNLGQVIKVSANVSQGNTQFLAKRGLRSTYDFQIYMKIYLPFLQFIKIIVLLVRQSNKYCLNLKVFNCISQLQHCILSYIIGKSGFQAKGSWLQTESLIWYSTLTLSAAILSMHRTKSTDAIVDFPTDDFLRLWISRPFQKIFRNYFYIWKWES